MTASRLTAVVLVSAVVWVAIPATASATDTGCDGSDALLRLSLDEECGLAATLLGIDVRLGGSEPEAEPDPEPTPSPSPSPSSAPPSTDGTGGTGGTDGTDGTIDANDTGDAGSAAEESGAAGGTQNGTADGWAGTDGSPPAAKTAPGPPVLHLAAPADAEPADAGTSIRHGLETPAIAEVDARERLSPEPPSQRSPWTRITGPLARLPGLEQPSFVTAGTVILAGLVLIALGMCAAATGLSLALRRRRSVSSL